MYYKLIVKLVMAVVGILIVLMGAWCAGFDWSRDHNGGLIYTLCIVAACFGYNFRDINHGD